jgi:hypothetical protein
MRFGGEGFHAKSLNKFDAPLRFAVAIKPNQPNFGHFVLTIARVAMRPRERRAKSNEPASIAVGHFLVKRQGCGFTLRV